MKNKNRLATAIAILGIASITLGTLAPFAAAEAIEGPAAYAGNGTRFSPLSDDAMKTKWNQQARDFDSAITEIQKILALDIESEKGGEEATRILERNIKKLQFVDSKILTGALRSDAFKKGVEGEAKKRGGGDKFASEFKRDPAIGRNIPGIGEAAREAESAIAPARELFTRLAAKFEAAVKRGQSSRQSKSLDNWYYAFTAEKRLGQQACGDRSTAAFPFLNACQALGINVIASACKVIYSLVLFYAHGIWTVLCGDNCILIGAFAWSTCIAKAGLSTPKRTECNSVFWMVTIACFMVVCN